MNLNKLCKISNFFAPRRSLWTEVVKFQKHNVEINYKVSEVTIPVPGGVIAGKLWEPKLASKISSPPIICLHGWLDNAGTFDTLLPLLMQNPSTSTSTFLALDLPGHGLTTYCPQWFYDVFIDGIILVQRVLRHYEWEKVSIIGHSLGSIVGFLFNGFYPETVHKYVAMDVMRPVPRSYLDTMGAAINLVFEVEERDRIPRKSYRYDDMVQRFYEARQDTVSIEGCRILLKRGAIPIGNIDGTAGCGARDLLYEYSYNFRTLVPGQEGRISAEISEELAQRITSPICYIKADPGNRYETDQEYLKFFKIFEKNLGKGGFESHLVPGTHHFHLNTPELVAPIIYRFLGL